MSYQPHRNFAAPARPTAQMPRLVIGVALIEAFNSGLRWLFDALLQWLPGISAQAVWYGSTRGGLLVQLGSFGFLALGVILAARRLHHRGLISLTGPLRPFWHDFRLALIAVAALFVMIEMLPPYWDISAASHVRSVPLWLLTLPLALLALAIQTGAEELFYRGYIQQQIAARYDRALIWMLVPNIMFALAHWEPGDFSTSGVQYMIWAFFFGLAASDLTARTGNLGAALGFHLANNAYAFLFFAEFAAPDSGLALLLFPQGSLSGDLVPTGPILSGPFLTELAGVGLMWLAARVALRR